MYREKEVHMGMDPTSQGDGQEPRFSHMADSKPGSEYKKDINLVDDDDMEDMMDYSPMRTPNQNGAISHKGPLPSYNPNPLAQVS